MKVTSLDPSQHIGLWVSREHPSALLCVCSLLGRKSKQMIANACLQSNIFQKIREKTQLKSASPVVQPKGANLSSQLIEHLFGEKINHITLLSHNH